MKKPITNVKKENVLIISDTRLRWGHSWGNVVSLLFNRNLHCTVPIKSLKAPFKVKVIQLTTVPVSSAAVPTFSMLVTFSGASEKHRVSG